MKFPKIKIRPNAGFRLLASAAVSFGAAFFGYFSYLEGMQREWEYLADSANKKGNTFFYDEDDPNHDRYLMFGKERSAELWNKSIAAVKNDDQESND